MAARSPAPGTTPRAEAPTASERARGSLARCLPASLLIALSLTGSPARATEPLASSRAPITHGQLDTEHPAVVGIGLRDPCLPDPATVVCSGTVIAPRVVLTAAHCLDFPPELGRVFFGENLDQSGDGVPIAGTRASAQFDRATFLGDLGVVWLAEDAPVAPIPLRTTPLSDADLGAQVQIVGYGLTDDGRDPPGQRRLGTSVLAALEATRFRTEPDPSMSCQLDSGGPVLLLRQGQPEVIGVTSSGDPFCQKYGLNTRVDAFSSFLVPALTGGPPGALPPVVCPVVLDCTIQGCEAGNSCDALSGACSPVRVLEPEGGCSLGSPPSPCAGLAGVLAAALLLGRRARAARRGQARYFSQYSQGDASNAARQR